MAKLGLYVLGILVACTYIVFATNVNRNSRIKRDDVSNTTTLESTTVTSTGEASTTMDISNGTTICVNNCGKKDAAKTGVIVGGVVAALVGLLLVVVIVIKCNKKRQRSSKKSEEAGAEREPLS